MAWIFTNILPMAWIFTNILPTNTRAHGGYGNLMKCKQTKCKQQCNVLHQIPHSGCSGPDCITIGFVRPARLPHVTSDANSEMSGGTSGCLQVMASVQMQAAAVAGREANKARPFLASPKAPFRPTFLHGTFLQKTPKGPKRPLLRGMSRCFLARVQFCLC